MSYISQVAEFHRAFRYKQPEPTTPDMLCQQTNKLRPKLMREELQEAFDACVKNDRVAILDGLCDLQYVHSGAVLAWGLRPMYSHLAPIIELRKIHNEEGHFFAMFSIIEQMEAAAENNYPMQVLSLLKSLEGRLTTMVWHYGFAPVFADAFAEVHRSNMSKIWSGVEMQANANPDVDTFEYSEGGYIARRADGKIVKSPGYSPARLERFV